LTQINPEPISVEETQEEPQPKPKLSLGHILRSYLLLIILAGGIVLLDQISKDWVRQNLMPYQSIAPIESLENVFRIVHAQNTGAAFGIFQQGSLIFTALAIVVAVVIVYYYPQIHARDIPLRLALGLQLGGALGNLVDRLTHGHVTDWIAVGDFPVFNVADASITTGATVLILGVWMAERQVKKAKKLEEEQAELGDLEVGEQV